MKTKTEFLLASIVLVALLTSTAAFAVDPVSISSRVIEAQSQLNVKGFDAASAVGSGYSDSINPYTGALTITQTDVVLPGRNGLNVVLTRQYSSNIFLNINHLGYGGAGGNNFDGKNINNIVCPDEMYTSCLLPNVVDGRSMNINDQPVSVGLDDSSLIRAKYLGRGWTMNYLENRIKTPTPLVYQPSGVGMVEMYDFVSARGINTLSMVVDNNEQQLILPSQYMDNSWVFDTFNPVGQRGWGADVAYKPFVVVQSGNIYPDFAGDLSDNITFLQAAVNNLKHVSITGQFVAYTQDLSPVQFWHNTGSTPIIPRAQYYAKDGKTYSFGYFVSFCDKYDDTYPAGNGDCNNIPYAPSYNPTLRSNIFNWAENPYAGSYPTAIYDTYGNYILIQYFGGYFDSDHTKPNSPFISSILAPGGRAAYFKYATKEDAGDYSALIPENKGASNLDLDSRLKEIQYQTPTGATLYQIYKYNMQTDSRGKRPPLLTETYLSTTSQGSSDIKGTKYVYEYDLTSQELKKVYLPTGAIIEYSYKWTNDLPVYDLMRNSLVMNNENVWPRRVVYKKTIAGGGECPDLANGGTTTTCSWTYDYGTVPNGQRMDVQTTVTDPFGNKVVYTMFPSTYVSLNH